VKATSRGLNQDENFFEEMFFMPVLHSKEKKSPFSIFTEKTSASLCNERRPRSHSLKIENREKKV